jgi:hypothetical protein
MRTNVSSLAKPALRAREHLPVRAAIAMWVVFAAAGPLCLAIVAADRQHAAVVFVCTGISLGWAALAAWLPSDDRYSFLYPASTLVGIGIVACILDRARRLLGASAASAGILEDDDIVYRYRTGPGANSGKVIRTPKDASLSGICLRTGEPAYCEDSELDPRVDKAACRAQALRSMIIVPLRHRGKVVGVLNVNSPEPRAFGPGDGPAHRRSDLRRLRARRGHRVQAAPAHRARGHGVRTSPDARARRAGRVHPAARGGRGRSSRWDAGPSARPAARWRYGERSSEAARRST